MKLGIFTRLTQTISSHFVAIAVLVIAVGLVGMRLTTLSRAASLNTGSCAIAGFGTSVSPGVAVTPAVTVANSSSSSFQAQVNVAESLTNSAGANGGETSMHKTITVPAHGHTTFHANAITPKAGYKLVVSAASTSGPSFSCRRTASAVASAMTHITINSFTASASPRDASSCNFSGSITFSTNGSGNVLVTWEQLSSKTSSAVENTVTHTFSAAGTQSDSPGGFSLQGLESGDSYRISVTLTDSSNRSITTTAGPAHITSCAGPQPLQSPGEASSMTSPVSPTTLTVSQRQDPMFTYECNMILKQSFTVGGPGSVQVVYYLTSSASVGATYYSENQVDFSGPGDATDIENFRMPNGYTYTISAKMNVLGDPARSATSAPITVACT